MSQYDAIVIGGGPAGSTAGALLAEHGHRVLLLEREPFRRYHIGESLIPYTWFTLNRLGVVDWLRDVGGPEEIQRAVRVDHRQGLAAVLLLPDDQARVRADLAGRAQRVRRACCSTTPVSKGVELRQGVTVRDVLMEGSRVVGVRRTKDGAKGEEIRAKVVVDATGRDSLLSRKFGWKDRDPDLNKIAVWSYFKGAMRDPGLDEGATTVAYVPQKGWFWYIPLHSDIVSRRRRRRARLPLPRHPRSERDLRARSPRLPLDSRARRGRRAVRAGARHRRVLVSLEADRRRRLLPRRRRVRVSRSAVLHRRLPRAQERRDGGRRDSRRALDRRQVSAHHFDDYLKRQRHAVTSFRNLVTRSTTCRSASASSWRSTRTCTRSSSTRSSATSSPTSIRSTRRCRSTNSAARSRKSASRRRSVWLQA